MKCWRVSASRRPDDTQQGDKFLLCTGSGWWPEAPILDRRVNQVNENRSYCYSVRPGPLPRQQGIFSFSVFCLIRTVSTTARLVLPSDDCQASSAVSNQTSVVTLACWKQMVKRRTPPPLFFFPVSFLCSRMSVLQLRMKPAWVRPLGFQPMIRREPRSPGLQTPKFARLYWSAFDMPWLCFVSKKLHLGPFSWFSLTNGRRRLQLWLWMCASYCLSMFVFLKCYFAFGWSESVRREPAKTEALTAQRT